MTTTHNGWGRAPSDRTRSPTGQYEAAPGPTGGRVLFRLANGSARRVLDCRSLDDAKARASRMNGEAPADV